MREIGKVTIEARGIGLIVYSPWAMRDVAPGSPFLFEHFEDPDDVAAYVRAGKIAAFCTGSPGIYNIELEEGKLDLAAIAGYPWMIELALEVRDRTVCIRDLFDLAPWDPVCPSAQTFTLEDGFYRVYAGTRPTNSGIVGDNQSIFLGFEPTPELPKVSWEGVPYLGEDDE